MEALTLDYLNSDYRRPLRPALGKRGANRAWEWIIGAGAILLFIALASAFVSYEPNSATLRAFLLDEGNQLASAISAE